VTVECAGFRRIGMARIFKYYDDWKTVIFECPKCGWKGTFDEGAVEYYEALMDSSCPACDFFSAPMLAIVSYQHWRSKSRMMICVSGRTAFFLTPENEPS